MVFVVFMVFMVFMMLLMDMLVHWRMVDGFLLDIDTICFVV